MDDIDRVQEIEQDAVAKKLADIARMMATKAKDIHCVACGDEIPEERRKSLPNAIRCVDCQSVTEKHSRFMR
jgi:DnaK suppressor protein